MERISCCLLMFFMSLLGNSCSYKNDTNVVYTNMEKTRPYENVSIEDLLKNPEVYNGKVIETIGFFSMGTEESAVYLDKRSFDNKNHENSLWITFIVQYPLVNTTTKVKLFASFQESDKINTKRIKIRGEFDAGFRGHLASYGGSITRVFYIESLN